MSKFWNNVEVWNHSDKVLKVLTSWRRSLSWHHVEVGSGVWRWEWHSNVEVWNVAERLEIWGTVSKWYSSMDISKRSKHFPTESWVVFRGGIEFEIQFINMCMRSRWRQVNVRQSWWHDVEVRHECVHDDVEHRHGVHVRHDVEFDMALKSDPSLKIKITLKFGTTFVCSSRLCRISTRRRSTTWR